MICRPLLTRSGTYEVPACLTVAVQMCRMAEARPRCSAAPLLELSVSSLRRCHFQMEFVTTSSGRQWRCFGAFARTFQELTMKSIIATLFQINTSQHVKCQLAQTQRERAKQRDNWQTTDIRQTPGGEEEEEEEPGHSGRPRWRDRSCQTEGLPCLCHPASQQP